MLPHRSLLHAQSSFTVRPSATFVVASWSPDSIQRRDISNGWQQVHGAYCRVIPPEVLSSTACRLLHTMAAHNARHGWISAWETGIHVARKLSSYPPPPQSPCVFNAAIVDSLGLAVRWDATISGMASYNLARSAGVDYVARQTNFKIRSIEKYE